MSDVSTQSGAPSPHDLPTLIQRDESSDGGTPEQLAFEVSPPLPHIKDYELLEVIGRGGMGVVFKARHLRLNRLVALKMIQGGMLSRAENLQRFEMESAAAAQLQHPNIVAVYEVGAHDDQPYFSMEYVQGVSLAQRVAEGVLPGKLAAHWLEQCARAVHFAHQKGILHRDLKPANVLLDEAEQPKITDFGLAKLMLSDSGQTRTGAILGTPSYMAPEQANARKDVGPACDIYSLGAILYETLTGRPPFRGETALATVAMVAGQEPVALRLLNPGVDRDLETICLKCLEKEPERRYATAADLADDLRAYQQGEPIAARRLGTLGRALKWCRRQPALAALLFITLTTLVTFAVVEWRMANEERLLREDAEQQRKDAQDAHQSAQVSEKAMRHLLYLSQMRQAQHAWESANLHRAERLLASWLPQPGQKDYRSWEWYYLHGLCEAPVTLAAHPRRASALAYSPDGQWLASAGGHEGKPGQVKIWHAGTGQLYRALPALHSKSIDALAFSPDSRLLATGSSDRTIRLWSLASGESLAELQGHTGAVTAVAFADQGKRLLSAGADRQVQLWDISTLPGDQRRAPLKKYREHSGDITALAVSEAAGVFATASEDETIRIWDLASGQVKHTLRGHEGEVMSLAFAPHGKQLVSGGGPGVWRGQVRLWDVTSGKLLQTHYGLSDRILSVACSSRMQFAAAGSDGVLHLWDEHHSSESICFRADPHMLLALAFSPDGKRLASAGGDGRVRLWNSSGTHETLRLPGQDRIEGVAFSPDSKLLASAGRKHGKDGELQLWSLATGTLARTLRGHIGQVRAVAFSADGRHVVTGGDDHLLYLYDLEQPQQAQRLRGHSGRVLAVAFHPKEARFASAGDDGAIRVWQVGSTREQHILKGHNNSVLALAFSPDGRYLASGSYDKTVHLWDLTGDLREPRVLHGHTGSTSALAFSADGTALASGSTDASIRIWDVARGKEYLRLEGTSRAVSAVAFHPQGQRLASVGVDRTVHLWDLITCQEIMQLEGARGALHSVAFSADGRWLGCAGDNTQILLWRAEDDKVTKTN